MLGYRSVGVKVGMYDIVGVVEFLVSNLVLLISGEYLKGFKEFS